MGTAADIATRGLASIDFPDAGHYATTDYSLILRVLKHLSLRPSDVFVDIGSGKGRILCCAARYPVRQVIGVDLSAELCEQARANAARARGMRSPIAVHSVGAEEFDYSACTAYYMFSPFGPDTLGEVLTKIEQDRAGGPSASPTRTRLPRALRQADMAGTVRLLGPARPRSRASGRVLPQPRLTVGALTPTPATPSVTASCARRR